ncbi:vancomycin high temperature exclusion protein [Winogradskyella sp. PG-2]|uniref:SanA/YdcF family protein n=1 Tax=Winogradskyella sp. PG-2 TaxID=754409 RepID=UPI0004586B4D|nr:ElyC/SanA/YdcF family protein [Winogradskyella sp. PG-2]BAO76614.1 SanA protein [Winogradskyella sp. PG-2]
MKKLKILLSLLALAALTVFTIYHWVSYKAKHNLYENVTKIPKNKVGLLLGVNKFTYHGNVNLFYKYRLDAAVALFKAGKIEYILVSGDNSRENYDEPTNFKNDLIARGIPSDKIFLDFAGFRTLDSVIRAKEVFGQNEITVISQKFHNQRAIYIADHFNIKAIAFNAKPVKDRNVVILREYLARSKAFIDLIFNVQPKFLGEKITIQ